MDLFVSPKERQKKKLFRRLKIYALVIVIIFLFWGVYFLLSELPIFKIAALEIEGAEKLSHSQIVSEIAPEIFQSYRAQLLGLDNIFSWPSGKINTANPLIANAEIKRDFFRREIKISVNEREKYGVWCVEDEKCSWFDKDGVIFSTKGELAPESDGNLIFKIKSDSAFPGSDFFKNLRKILENIKDDFIFEDFYFENKSMDLKTKMVNGPNLIFNLRFDPEINLEALKKMKEKKNLQQLKLIDLRIPNKIFYR